MLNANTVLSLSADRAGAPWVPFQTISQDSDSHMSQMSDPLFTEDRYSASSDEDQQACDTEVDNITR